MRTNRYPSDVTDEQWALIRDLIPVYPGGRPRKTNLRDVVDAVFYVPLTIKNALNRTAGISNREKRPPLTLSGYLSIICGSV